MRGRKGQEQGRWEVTNDQILLLNVKGGDGGDGGRGEDGQQGGAGRRGRNATKYRDAEVDPLVSTLEYPLIMTSSTVEWAPEEESE